MSDNGYGSASFVRACDLAKAARAIESSGARATWRRLRAGAPALAWYRLRLPSVRVRLTGSAEGRMIAEHYAIRERGRRRFRGAQGVLPLPDEFSRYLRGRHRQAVRTNLSRAREAGLAVESLDLDVWAPGAVDTRAGQITPGPVERWMVVDPDGAIVADSILSVDDEVALLHGLVSSVTFARWLLHTAIVESLCGRCEVLLTNSEDACLMDSGNQHFQRLLGYRIARLRLSRPDSDSAGRRPSPTEVELQRGPAG